MVLRRLTLLVKLIVSVAVVARPQWFLRRLALLHVVTLIFSVAVVARPQWSLKDLRY